MAYARPVARGKLNERHVQKTTLDWLIDHYESRPEIVGATGQLEAWVVDGSSHGSGRADGVIACATKTSDVLCVSLEAKSHKTRHNLVPRMSGCLPILGLAILLAGVAAVGAWQLVGTNHSGVRLFATVGASVVVFVAALDLLLRSAVFSAIAVVEQVKRYPAHERWIALPSERSLTKYAKAVMVRCTREGIGLLSVRSGGEAQILVEPTRQATPSRNWLTEYKRGAELEVRLRSKRR